MEALIKHARERYQNPRIELDLQYGELCALVNFVTDVLNGRVKSSDVWAQSQGMQLIRELALLRDKAMLERRAEWAEKVCSDLTRELAQSDQRIRVAHQELDRTRQDLSRQRGETERRGQRIQQLVKELEQDRSDLERVRAEAARLQQAAHAERRNGDAVPVLA